MSAARMIPHAPQRLSLAVAAGAFACVVVAAAVPFVAAALPAWTAAAVFWSAIPIGAVGLLAMMRLIPGRWNVALSVFAEAAALLLPLAGVSLLPLLFDMSALYPWTEGVETGAFQAAWLQGWFYWLRTGIWLLFLGVLAWALVGRHGRARPVATAGIIAFTVLGSLIAVDWLLSMHPRFRSSGFGLYVLSIQLGVALFATCLARLVAVERPPRSGLIGALVLVALLLWGYLAFMQYFVVWSGNRPEAARWYLERSLGFGQVVVWAIILLHAVPAALLLGSQIRRNRTWLIGLTGAALAGKLVEVLWLVLPRLAGESLIATLMFLVLAQCGLGALYTAGFGLALRSRLRRRAPHGIGGQP